jgi:hypothetical protein
VHDQHPYATNKLHSDVWSGDPLDAMVAHFPLFGDTENLGVEFAEIPADEELATIKIFKSYDKGLEFEGRSKGYGVVNYRQGFACFADSRLLHKTIRRSSGLRVSLDIRVRMKTDGAFRQIANENMSPDRNVNYLNYAGWSKIGSESLLVFPETVAEAEKRFRGMVPASTLSHPSRHVLVKLI